MQLSCMHSAGESMSDTHKYWFNGRRSRRTWVRRFPSSLSLFNKRRRDGGEGRGVEGKYILPDVIDAEILRPIFRSTPKSRPNKVSLRCPSVRPSTKGFSDSDEIWYVGRGR